MRGIGFRLSARLLWGLGLILASWRLQANGQAAPQPESQSEAPTMPYILSVATPRSWWM